MAYQTTLYDPCIGNIFLQQKNIQFGFCNMPKLFKLLLKIHVFLYSYYLM